MTTPPPPRPPHPPPHLLYISLYISQARLHSSRTCRATMTLVPHHDSRHIAAILFKSAVQGNQFGKLQGEHVSVGEASRRCRDIKGEEVAGGHRGHGGGGGGVTTLNFSRRISQSVFFPEVRERISFTHGGCVHWQ